jgi:hypothetical protein
VHLDSLPTSYSRVQGEVDNIMYHMYLRVWCVGVREILFEDDNFSWLSRVAIFLC